MNEFNPDWRSPPGDTIKDLLELKGLAPDQLAASLGLTEHDLHLLLVGELIITDDIAATLEHVLGGSQAFWLKRDADFRKPLV